MAGAKVREGELLSKLVVSERRVGRLGDVVAQLEAGLLEVASEDQEAPYRARRSAFLTGAPCQEQQHQQQNDANENPNGGVGIADALVAQPLEDLVGTWSRARAALGL